MRESITRLEMHADSARSTSRGPTMTLESSYLPGHITITLEDPARLLVVERAELVEALAPDLLEALKGMIEVYAVSTGPHSLANSTEIELAKMARAAVAKVEGV